MLTYTTNIVHFHDSLEAVSTCLSTFNGSSNREGVIQLVSHILQCPFVTWFRRYENLHVNKEDGMSGWIHYSA